MEMTKPHLGEDSRLKALMPKSFGEPSLVLFPGAIDECVCEKAHFRGVIQGNLRLGLPH
jgi:hypothetical protein